MGSTARGRVHSLPLARQQLDLARVMPNGKCSVRKGRLTWRGDITPSAISSTYTINIDFVVGKRPKVTVVSPELARANGAVLKHTYDNDELCLYLPGQWDSSMSIAETIIPWTSEWLFHYETWAVTGHWNGGGHEFAPRSSRTDREAAAPRG